MKSLSLSMTSVLGASMAALALAACSPSDRNEVRTDTTRAAETVKNEASSMTNKAGNVIDDAALTTKVKAALLADEMVKGTQINVDSSNGTVTLNGAVSTATHKQRAEQLAMNVDGVRSVQNRLRTQ